MPLAAYSRDFERFAIALPEAERAQARVQLDRFSRPVSGVGIEDWR